MSKHSPHKTSVTSMAIVLAVVATASISAVMSVPLRDHVIASMPTYTLAQIESFTDLDESLPLYADTSNETAPESEGEVLSDVYGDEFSEDEIEAEAKAFYPEERAAVYEKS